LASFAALLAQTTAGFLTGHALILQAHLRDAVGHLKALQIATSVAGRARQSRPSSLADPAPRFFGRSVRRQIVVKVSRPGGQQVAQQPSPRQLCRPFLTAQRAHLSAGPHEWPASRSTRCMSSCAAALCSTTAIVPTASWLRSSPS
jgi:hypothetical protein